jgi:outer membrane protein OmpA-like peptidoglycan-associated protein
LFSSIKLGGYGGYDLYYAVKTQESWSKPINFGAQINTSFNDSSPFLTKGGIKLFFASDRVEGFGGYDLFNTDFEENIGWSPIINLGLGINSSKDDIHIELSADGLSALFASNRIESFGGYDIYQAYFKEQVIDQLGYVDIPSFTIENTSFESANANSNLNNQPEVTYPNRDFLNQPLYFKDNDDVLNTGNLNIIKKLVDLLIIYPDAKILLSSHFLTEGRPEMDIYFSIKRAEKVADNLINHGISPHRILLRGCGANYPIALPLINGLPSSLANKTNKRIDFTILETEGLNLNVTNEYPIVAEQYRDKAWDEFRDKNLNLTYRVKFAKVSQMLKSNLIDPKNDVVIEKKASESTYTYIIGNYTLLKDAISLKESLIGQDVPFATIRPYVNGVELNDIKIALLLDTYPSLNDFLALKN